MTKATITFKQDVVLDLTDPDIQEMLTPFLQANGGDGMVSADDIRNAIKDCIDNDPDDLLPRFDDNFDSSNLTIVVNESMNDEANAISVEPAKDDE